MKDGAYIVIQSFMLEQLHLKGNELIVYAVVYGFTQDGEHWYYGTRRHLSEWCGATKGTVGNCLSSLVSKGYLRRREVERHGITEVQYQAVLEIVTPYCKNWKGGAKNCKAPLLKIGSIDNKGKYSNNKPNDNGEAIDEELGRYADELDVPSA